MGMVCLNEEVMRWVRIVWEFELKIVIRGGL